jgi:hypothetical protein
VPNGDRWQRGRPSRRLLLPARSLQDPRAAASLQKAGPLKPTSRTYPEVLEARAAAAAAAEQAAAEAAEAAAAAMAEARQGIWPFGAA